MNWIDVPYVSPTKPMREALTSRLVDLEMRMPMKEYMLASDLVLTMASGHWRTFDSIVSAIKDYAFQDTLWLSTVYYENVRDVIVQSKEYNSKKWNVADMPQTYKILLMMAIFGVKVHPFNDKLSFPDNENEMKRLKDQGIISLNDMAYHRIVQNRIAISETTFHFCTQTPYLSMFGVGV